MRENTLHEVLIMNMQCGSLQNLTIGFITTASTSGIFGFALHNLIVQSEAQRLPRKWKLNFGHYPCAMQYELVAGYLPLLMMLILFSVSAIPHIITSG